MNQFNNIGGIQSVQFLFVDEIKAFGIVSNTAVLQLESNHNWRQLPAIRSGITPKAEQSDTDSLYKHSVTIRLNRTQLTDSHLNILRTTSVRGCILRYCDNAGNDRILGTKDYPLFGKITETPGTKPTDLNHYELTLSGKSTHPQLSYTSI